MIVRNIQISSFRRTTVLSKYPKYAWAKKKDLLSIAFLQPPSKKTILEFMSGSSHIESVLIGIEFWMFIYFLLFGLGTLKKRIYRLVTSLASL